MVVIILFFSNITLPTISARCIAQFAEGCTHARVRARRIRVSGDACELIGNDSSTKRIRALGNLGKMRRAHRPEEILNRIRLSDFPTLLFFFIDAATRTWPRLRLSSIQAVASDAENNEAIQRNVNFSVTFIVQKIFQSDMKSSEIILII